jgi:hypothetical protein
MFCLIYFSNLFYVHSFQATHDPETFDDDDFFQILVKEVIEQRSSQASNDPIAMSRS